MRGTPRQQLIAAGTAFGVLTGVASPDAIDAVVALLVVVAAGVQVGAAIEQMRGGARLALGACAAPAVLWAAAIPAHVAVTVLQFSDLWELALIDAAGYAAIALGAAVVVQAAIALVGLVAAAPLRRAHLRGEGG